MNERAFVDQKFKMTAGKCLVKWKFRLRTVRQLRASPCKPAQCLAQAYRTCGDITPCACSWGVGPRTTHHEKPQCAFLTAIY